MNRYVVPTISAFAIVLIPAALLLITPGPVTAQGDACAGASYLIEGGDPSRFGLPSDAGSTLRVESDAVLRIGATAAASPPAHRQVRLSVSGLGFDLEGVTIDLGSGAALNRVSLEVGEVLPSFARGLYRLDAILIDDGTERCTVSFDIRVGEFGGPVATAAAATTAVAGAGVLLSVPLTSNGMNARLKLKVQLQRRRPTGWRRILPVPAWKRTIISTLIGAITGLATALVLQQAGQAPLSITTAITGLVAGGGLTFGMGYSLGVLRTFLRPPEVPEEQA